jgi:hypothetical protein
MPKNISGIDPTQDGVFGQILVNTFAVQLNASSTGFNIYNSVSTSPLFKIDGSGLSPSATFYCDLNVVGNASFTSVSNIAVTSSMMSLATGNNAADLVDIGFYGLYHSGSNKYRGLVHSTGLGRWALFKDVTVVPSTTITLAGSWQDTLEVHDIYFNGDGSTLSALQTNVNGFPAELKNLTTTEIQQLENIGVLTISSAQWTYLSQTNQRVDTAGTPSFSGLTLSTGVLSLPAGTIGAPSLNWGDSNTGLYRTALNQIGITTGSSLIASWSTTGLAMNTGAISALAGSVGAPSLNLGDTATGLYRPGSNQIGITTGSSLITSWSTTGLAMNTGAISALAGSVGTPSLNFSDTTTGFYRPGSNQIGISVSGSNVATWSSTGLAMNTLAISGVSTLTATTLQGTLNSSSASQPNITTLAGVTSLGTSSASISIGTLGTFVNFNSSDVSGIRALTVTGGAISLTPSVSSSSDVSGCIISPTVANGSSITNARGIYSNPVFTPSNLSSMTNCYALYIDVGSENGAGNATNAYSGYFSAPTYATTSNMALYTANLNVGYTAVTPPSNGAIISGAVAIGVNAQTNSRKLYVLGDIEASTNLYGTIATTTQGSISTLAGVTSIGTSGTVSILNKLSVGTTSPAASATGYITSSGNTELWINSGATTLANLVFGKSGVSTWQNYVNNSEGTNPILRWYFNAGDVMTLSTNGLLVVANVAARINTAAQPNITSLGTLSSLTMGGNIAMGSNSITGGGTATFTTLSGTLSTAAQTNITSLGTLTGLTVNGTTTATYLVTSGFQNTTPLTIGGTNSTYVAVNINGTIIGQGGLITIYDQVGIVCQPFMKPSLSTNWGISSHIIPKGEVVNARTTTNQVGLFITEGSFTLNGTGTITNGYGAYIMTPTYGTNKIALFTGNLSVGYTAVTPPTNGMIVSGAVAIGVNAQTNSRKLYVLGDIEASTNLFGTIGTAAQTNITSLGTLSSLTMGGEISMPNDRAITFRGTTGNLAENIYTDGSNNLVMSWYNSSGAYQGDAFKIQNSNGNILGTLGTVAQPNITSIGSLTGLRVNGLVGINQAGSIPYYLGITIDNTNYGGLSISGTSTDNTAASHYGAYIGPGYKPTNTNSNYYTCLQLAPVFASSASQTLSGPCTSLYISDFFTGNAGTISGAYGILYDGGGPLAGSITNHYGGYFNIPAAGTNKFALFAGNIAVGSAVVPPTNGIYSLGSVVVGAGSTSVNGLGYNADNTIGLNFATGTMNLCVAGANQLSITSGSVAVQNGTTLATSQTNISGDAAHLLMRASNTNRWGIGMQGTESSGNAGSNLVFFNYDDSAFFKSDALVITRSNNKFSPQGPVNLVTYTDNTNGNLTAGTYTPTYTTTVGSVSTTLASKYMRIGSQVHVSGRCTVSPGGSSFGYTITMTLPFTRGNGNFASGLLAAGTGTQSGVASTYSVQISSTTSAQTLSMTVSFDTASSFSSTIAYNIIYEN